MSKISITIGYIFNQFLTLSIPLQRKIFQAKIFGPTFRTVFHEIADIFRDILSNYEKDLFTVYFT